MLSNPPLTVCFSMARNSTPPHRPSSPLPGSTAAYLGGAGDLYRYHDGRAGDELAGSSEFTEFQGPLSLIADFDGTRLAGCLGCSLGPIEIAPGCQLFPSVPRQGSGLAALPADYKLPYAASFDAAGAFEDTAIIVTNSERAVTRTAST